MLTVHSLTSGRTSTTGGSCVDWRAREPGRRYHQWLAAIIAADAPAVRKAVAKFMSAEPNKQEREFNGFTI